MFYYQSNIYCFCYLSTGDIHILYRLPGAQLHEATDEEFLAVKTIFSHYGCMYSCYLNNGIIKAFHCNSNSFLYYWSWSMNVEQVFVPYIVIKSQYVWILSCYTWVLDPEIMGYVAYLIPVLIENWNVMSVIFIFMDFSSRLCSSSVDLRR